MKYRILSSAVLVAFFCNVAWADEAHESRMDAEIQKEKISKKINAANIATNKAAIAAIQLTPGPQGPDGAQGPQGIQGLPGATGAQGLTGAAGTNGADGAPGLTGAAGPAGPTGPAGADGATGPAGPAGADGAAATAGIVDVTGGTVPSTMSCGTSSCIATCPSTHPIKTRIAYQCGGGDVVDLVGISEATFNGVGVQSASAIVTCLTLSNPRTPKRPAYVNLTCAK